MLLNEFFGKSIKPIKDKNKGQDNGNLSDDLFWYIVDHDKIHKDYFFPIAKKIKNKKEDLDKEQVVSELMPMVVKGCKEYYAHKKLKGRLGQVFSKELRKEMCERIFDHYKEDVANDKYKLGL
jgi:hypothetical protein